MSAAEPAAPLRDAAWLRPDRAIAVSNVLLATWVVCLGLMLWFAVQGAKPDSVPEVARDFASFWTAGGLALTGHAADVYDVQAHLAAQQALYAGAKSGYAAFFYPPVFLFACLPLALLPFGAAAVLFVAGTGALYVAAIRRILPRSVSWPVALAFPSAFVNAAYVQNGFLSAGLFGFAAVWLERRPVLAGMCLGALAYKPQLGVLVPLALAVAGRWRAFAAAAATVLALLAGSLLAFGAATWDGFLTVAPVARQWLQDGTMGFGKLVSVFGAARLLGAPLAPAYAAQGVASVAAIALLVAAVRRRPGAPAECAALAAATLLATPFALQYDLVLLAVPMAWLLGDAVRSGWLGWERLALAVVWLSPLLSLLAPTAWNLPLAPLFTALLLALVVRRQVLARN